MDLVRVRNILRTARVVTVYVLIALVVVVALASFNESLLPLTMNIMTAVIFVLVGVTAMESITASAIKSRKTKSREQKEGKKKEGFEEPVKGTNKRSVEHIDFTEGNAVEGEDSEWLQYLVNAVKAYPKSAVLAGLTETLVEEVGKDKAVAILHRDVDADALGESYSSFIKSIDREEVEDFKYDVAPILDMMSDKVSVIKALIELVARDFGREKKDIVYAVLAKYASTF